eukprot:COSAG05_NODE_10876_length_541_cov_1.115385_2_plen_97_part_00
MIDEHDDDDHGCDQKVRLDGHEAGERGLQPRLMREIPGLVVVPLHTATHGQALRAGTTSAKLCMMSSQQLVFTRIKHDRATTLPRHHTALSTMRCS